MTRLIKWGTLAAALCCLVLLFRFYATNPQSIFEYNHKALIRILLMIGMFISIYQTASSLIGPSRAGSNAKNVPNDYWSVGGWHPNVLASKETSNSRSYRWVRRRKSWLTE